MKKRLFVIGCFVLVPFSLFATTRAAIFILHQGVGTTYDNTQLSIAMDAAQHGDTIYLSEGAFDVDTLVVDKVVSIIGAGEATKIRGDVHIGIDDNPQMSNRLFDAIDIQGDVKVIKELQGLRFRKCKIETFWASAEVRDIEMDRCSIHIFLPVNVIKSASFVNCWIDYVGYDDYPYTTKFLYYSALNTSSKGNDLNFLNCTIQNVISSSSNAGDWILAEDAAFVNCHIASCGPYGGNCSFTNTLLRYELKSNCTVHNCYFDEYHLMKDYTEELLIAKGYLGNDGTVVGYVGGSTPYTLVPSGITVTESQLKVDPEKKELNVTLKISANQ